MIVAKEHVQCFAVATVNTKMVNANAILVGKAKNAAFVTTSAKLQIVQDEDDA